MVRGEEKELNGTQKDEVQVVEQEITLSLLNQKLNYIISILDKKK